MWRKLAGAIAGGVGVGLGLVIYLAVHGAHQEAQKEGLPTSNHALPVMPAAPTVRENGNKNPPPPPSAVTDNRGAVNRFVHDLVESFKGPCSIRSKVINISSTDWTPLMESDDECQVVYDVPQGGGIGQYGGEKFELKPGITKNPTAVKANHPDTKFKYSLCPNPHGKVALDWGCKPQAAR